MSTWTPPPVHSTYHELKMLSEVKVGLSGGPNQSQAEATHRKWKSLGKKVQKGRL